MRRLIILGAGGYGRTVADLAQQLGVYASVDFLDDRAETALDPCTDYLRHATPETELYPAFGNNELRVQWLRRLLEDGCRVATLIHPRAYVSPTATVAPGCVLLPGAILNTGSTLGMGCILNCGAVVDHDCTLQEGVHICLNAVVKADNHLPRCLKLEAGNVLENGTYA